MNPLLNKIASKEIKAIAIDTCIFEGKQFQFEYGILNSLSQFRNSEIRILIPEIILNEIQGHMIEETSKIFSDMNKSIKQMQKISLINPENKEEISKNIFHDFTPETHSKKRLDEFLEKVNCLVLKTSNNFDLRSLVNLYFKKEPPFKYKKNEFPDAIALLNLNEYAVENRTDIIVISNDKDWISFCEKNERLHSIDDLTKALSLFHDSDKLKNFCHFFTNEIFEPQDNEFSNEIKDSIDEQLWKVDIFPVCDTGYRYDSEVIETSLISYKLTEKDTFGFYPIDYENGYITLQAIISLEVEIESAFSFTLYDEGEIDMGGTRITDIFTIEVEIILKIESDLSEKIENMSICEITIDGTYTEIDYGSITPDWMGLGIGEET